MAANNSAHVASYIQQENVTSRSQSQNEAEVNPVITASKLEQSRHTASLLDPKQQKEVSSPKKSSFERYSGSNSYTNSLS